ncbi:alpha/beta fold hydrolase [Virgibacillus salexigens]|uniref:alpha/beta fold hydrolase n=1 Tax=Virgibacillus salexigens TaxID=61016 RepID=UPI00190AC453|nr:alpha/beta fold hydrolase [Virgibacillus salexigens]
MYANINDTTLYFDVDGAQLTLENGQFKEKPVVFVLHGGPGGSHSNFKPHLDALTKEVQLVYIDQRGCGYSAEEDNATYTLTQNVADIEALREYLGLESIWILGHSYGGMVAMQYALQHGTSLNGLILATTSPSYQFIKKAKQFINEQGNEEQKYYANILWEGGFQSEQELQAYYQAMSSLYSHKISDNQEQVRPSVKRSYQALNKGFGGFLKNFDVRDDLHTITCPTLIIAGRYDWVTPVSESQEIHQRIPGSTFHILENSSHSVFIDENEKTISLIQAFIETHL